MLWWRVSSITEHSYIPTSWHVNLLILRLKITVLSFWRADVPLPAIWPFDHTGVNGTESSIGRWSVTKVTASPSLFHFFHCMRYHGFVVTNEHSRTTSVPIMPLLNRSVTSEVCRSEEHRLNSSHANISYAVFCLKKKIS